MIDTILFDLDGTLLPMEENEFVETYMTQLVRKFAPRGFDGKSLVKALWAGVKQMTDNDGAVTNETRFWDEFQRLVSDEKGIFRSQINDFYTNEFHRAKSVVKDRGFSGKIIETLKQKGYRLILATNPLFPRCAVESRLSWVGLSPEDFSYMTTYENSTSCKPNPLYYYDILKENNLKADRCMMVGNNVREDMCVKGLKDPMEMFLVTDFLINPHGENIDAYPHGTLEEFAKKVEEMPDISEKEKKPLILASKSPRRRELMAHLKRDFIVVVSDEEEVMTTSKPSEVVMELALRKAAGVSKRVEEGSIIIGSDTVVASDGKILGKPKTREEAVYMLQKLSGRTHSVYTGVALYEKKGEKARKDVFYEETKVEFYPLTETEIEAYVDSGDPFDKAGAYGIQTGAAVFVKGIEGDYNTVVGLPVASLYHHLKIFENNDK